MTLMELQAEMKERRRQAFHRERAWWWFGPTGKIKIGVLQGLGDSWIVGHIKENGARKKLNSSQLAKYQPSTDPDRLLKIVEEWAKQRELQEVQW